MAQVNPDSLSIIEIKALLLDEIDKMEVANRNAQQLRTILNQKIQKAGVKPTIVTEKPKDTASQPVVKPGEKK